MTPGITMLLDRWENGDQAAMDALVPALYQEMRRMAARHLRSERAEHTLQATALVHEAYLKLFYQECQHFNGKAHFMAVASRIMRHILVDYGRSHVSQKRGGAEQHVTWTSNLEVHTDKGAELIDIIELNNALEALTAEDAHLAKLVEMRYFGGMTAEETAEALSLSVHVVRHDLQFAQAWLRRRLTN